MSDIKQPDFGTPEMQRRGIERNQRNTEGQQVAQRTDQRRIDTLHRRKNITDEQYAAANCFLCDAYYAGLEGSIKSGINFEVVGNRMIEDGIDARNRFYEAADSLKKYELSIVQMLVLGDHLLIDISPIRKFQDEASDIFKTALDKLAVFYGIVMRRGNEHG